MKTQLFTLSSLLILSFSGVVSASDITDKENQDKTQQTTKSYHSQDVRNVQSNVSAGYDSYENGDQLSLDGTYGINDKASVGLSYSTFSSDYHSALDYDAVTLSGQYNLSDNIVLDGEWNISGEYDNLTVGGNYVADASFGVWNVGANYSSGDLSDGLDFEAGVLVPFGNMYYRGDFTYFLDSGVDSVFENALGWTNGKVDVNASVAMYEFDDTSVGIEFSYLF